MSYNGTKKTCKVLPAWAEALLVLGNSASSLNLVEKKSLLFLAAASALESSPMLTEYELSVQLTFTLKFSNSHYERWWE